MTIAHHPTEETLFRLATGALAIGPTLVVRAHTEVCPACRDRVSAFTAVGGALLHDEAPLAVSADALAHTLARLDAPRPVAAPVRRRRPDLPAGFVMPEALASVDMSPWRTLAPGLRYSDLDLPRRRNARTILLRFAPGMALPQHGHHAAEYTMVLCGAYSDSSGTYRPGDLSEAHEDLNHKPIVGGEEECIAVIASEGRFRFQDMAVRLMQPLLGF